MNVELITKQDLREFKNDLVNEIKQIMQPGQGQSKQWLKSVEVRKLLNISPGTLQNLRIQKSKAQLHELIDDYYSYDETESSKYENKLFIKNEINQIVEGKLLAKFYLQKPKIAGKILDIITALSVNSIVSLDAPAIKLKKEKNLLKLNRELDIKLKEQDRLDEIIKNLHELETRNDKPYFLWHLWFKDVFDNKGFDIVIGNPPYIQLQKLGSESDVLQKANYHTFTRTGDIYCLFYEQGINLLKPGGALCYITSNTWMRTKFGELLRGYFAERTNPIKLLNFEDTKIFQTATVEANIILLRNEHFRENLAAVAVRGDYTLGSSINDYFHNNFIALKALPNDGWVILNKSDYEIKTLMECNAKQLKDWDVQINFGFKTGFNEPFFINESKKKELIELDPSSKDIIKPLLRGRDIRKYAYKFNNEYVIWSHNGIKGNKKNNNMSIPRIDVEKDFKAIYNHLLLYKDKDSPLAVRNTDGTYKTLVDRTDQGDHWTNLRDCAFADLFEKPKLIWLGISDKPAFAFDEKHYITNPANFLSGGSLKYLMSVLNSKAIEWYLDKITSSTGQGTNQWKKIYVEQLPIPPLKNQSIQQKFEIIADYLIYLNNDDNPAANPYTDNLSIVPVFEDVLNMMVYELYFYEHMIQQELDVLKFVNPEVFQPIGENQILNAQLIGEVYKWLQQQENPIRNRVILSNIRSKEIVRRINSTTH